MQVKLCKLPTLKALWRTEKRHRTKLSRHLSADRQNRSDEEALDWLRSFPDLAHLRQRFEDAAPTAAALLQMDSDSSLTAMGVESAIDRAQLMLATRRARLSAAMRGACTLQDEPAWRSAEMCAAVGGTTVGVLSSAARLG